MTETSEHLDDQAPAGAPEDSVEYLVVINDEEQYSIWRTDRELPAGWYDVGTRGTKDHCLDHIETVWTDMRPLSLRRWMEQEHEPVAEDEWVDDLPPLVDRLSGGPHDLVFTSRPEPTPERLRRSLERGLVFLKFTGTRGGTELGVRLTSEDSERLVAEHDQGRNPLLIDGTLTLDFVPVRCRAELDTGRLEGTGHLERVGSE